MFELTISTTADKQSYIDDIYQKLGLEVKKDLGVIARQNYGGRSYLGLAVKPEKKEYYKAKILDHIVYMIADDYKQEFFKERLELPSTSVIFDSFLKAITVFDYNLDKEIIRENIELSGEILVDSLYYFKLGELRSRWLRTAEIIASNKILQSVPSMIEVLSYLTSTSENRAIVTEIHLGKKQIKLKNFSKFKIYKRNFEGVSEFFTELVRLNPLKINLKMIGISENTDEVTDILNKIFYDKIYLKK